MKKTIVSLTIFLFVMPAISTPTWMWVGTHAINDYTGNGGGGDLGWGIWISDAFWNGAANFSPIAYRYLNRTDAACTYANISNNGAREALDFFYYYGHGNPSGLFLGDGAGYGMVGYPQLAFGTNYTRWVYSDACQFLNFESGSDWATKSQMMRGVQVVLGFVSVGVHNWWCEDEVAEFWEHWTDGDEGIWESFRHSVIDNSYSHGYFNAEIAAVTGNSAPPNYINFHAHSYDEATSAKAMDGISYVLSCFCHY